MTARTSADVRALWPYARYFPRLVALTAAAGLLSSLAEGLGVSLFIPLLHELDRGALAGGPSDRFAAGLTALFAGIPSGLRLWVVGSCILGAVLVRSCLSYATQLLYAALDERVGARLRSGIFAQLLELEFGYWERRGSDELFHTLADETWRTSEALKLMVSLVVTCSALAVYLLVVLLIDWKMTLVVSLAMLALHTLTRKLTGRAAALGRLVARTNTALTKRMIEAFEGMKVIRVFARERYEQQRFDAASRRVGRALMRTARMQALSGPVMELLTAILVVGLVVTAGSRQQDLPTLLVFLFILYRLQPKVRDLSNALVALATLQAAVEHVTALLRRDDKPYTSGGSLPFQGLRQGIRFDRVSFAYGDDEPALHEVTAFIPQGRTTALVGPSGAGKSTFVKLLQRLYDPTGGEITFDDQPLAAFELGSLRRRIAVVSQDVYLFDRSVRSNIAYGRSDAGLEQVIEAARQADAHGFIMEMAGGYEARVGERGDGLSGGQAQRIALARAIVARPDLLILDEATNSLDSISESVVRDALAALHGKCTIVIVAHRFDTIERADNIIVIDAGRVREQGSFRSLLGRGGLFAQLHALQSRGAASDRAGGYG